MRLVAVPADANPHAVFGTENLLNSGCRASEGLDACNDFRQPGGDRFGALQLVQLIIVAEAERSYPPLAFKLPESKRLKREGLDSQNKFLFDSRRYEVSGVAQSFWLRTRSIKQGQLLEHEASLSGCQVCRFSRRMLKGWAHAVGPVFGQSGLTRWK